MENRTSQGTGRPAVRKADPRLRQSARTGGGGRNPRARTSAAAAQAGPQRRAPVSSKSEPRASRRASDASRRTPPQGGPSHRGGHATIARVAVIAAAALCIVFAADAFATSGHIHHGVHIGEVDVSEMAPEEAAAAVAEAYNVRLFATDAYIFSDEQMARAADVEAQLIEQDALTEQMSFEAAQEQKTLWKTNAASLGAQIPAERLVDEAYGIGRGFDVVGRVQAALSGRTVDVEVDYDEDLMNELIYDIDSSAGVLMRDWGIDVDAGCAFVTEGNDGRMVDTARFERDLTEALLRDDAAQAVMAAHLEPVGVNVGPEAAAVTCDAVNALIADGASFSLGGQTIDADRQTLGEWVTAHPTESGGAWRLDPTLDAELARNTLFGMANMDSNLGDIVVTFSKEADGVLVHTNEDVKVPAVDAAVSKLDADLFGPFRKDGTVQAGAAPFGIPIDTVLESGPFTFDQALSYGVISEISSYTTNYTNTGSTVNRNHNIHKVAGSFNDNIVPANGGVWSFNEIAGDCNEENGYLEASAIYDGEVVQSSGGGICQVATTVFNAVYESGLPILERANHSLHMSSYPDGRDAAVSYPELDLKWENDTASDVLVRTGWTDTSVTVSLFGVDPGYTVESVAGQWEEGEKYVVKVEIDENLASGTQYVKTAGSDGVMIAVTRTVTDKWGNQVRQGTFSSVYSPVDKIVVAGPDTKVDTRRPEEMEADEEAKAAADAVSTEGAADAA